MYGFYRPPTWFAVVSSALTLIGYPAVLVLALVGTVSAPTRDRRAVALFVLLILFTCAVHAVTFGHSRYHLPLVPIGAMYAGAALAWPRRTAAALGSAAILVPAVAIAACMAIWVREIAVRDALHIASLLTVLRSNL